MSKRDYQKLTILVLILILVGTALAYGDDPGPMPPPPPPVTPTLPKPPVKTVPVRVTPIWEPVVKWRVYLPIVCLGED